jgi:RsiW-degrading membrane proteinase PrsW (M82 family)
MTNLNNTSVSFVNRLKYAAALFTFGMVGTTAVIWFNRWLIESMNVPPTNLVAGIAVVGMFVSTIALTLMVLIGKFDQSITALDR